MKKICVFLLAVSALLCVTCVFVSAQTTDTAESTTVSVTMASDTTGVITTTVPSTVPATTTGAPQTITPRLLILERGGRIAARLLTSNGTPIGGATVSLQLESTKMNAVTDAAGYAVFSFSFPTDGARMYCESQPLTVGNITYKAAMASAGSKLTTKEVTTLTTGLTTTTTEVTTSFSPVTTLPVGIQTEWTELMTTTSATQTNTSGGGTNVVSVLLWIIGIACIGGGAFLLFRFFILPKINDLSAEEQEEYEEDEETEEPLETDVFDDIEPAPLRKRKDTDIDIPL